MITRTEVEWLYRCLFGREPESEEAVAVNCAAFATFEDARRTFMSSREFIASARGADASERMLYQPRSWRPFSKIQQRIGLAAIVKDEVGRIGRMLQSALPLIDFVSLVDTGSIDGTQDLAEGILKASQVSYELNSIEFIDFSQARNEALAHVPSWIEWVLILDADEHLVAEDYQLFVDLTEVAGVDAWCLPRLNFVDQDKAKPAAPYPDYQSRLFRNRVDAPIHFFGAVHEVLLNVSRWGMAPTNEPFSPRGGPHIHHMGQVDLTIERFNNKHSFYERLSKRS